jgi:hypothetical protein
MVLNNLKGLVIVMDFVKLFLLAQLENDYRDHGIVWIHFFVNKLLMNE